MEARESVAVSTMLGRRVFPWSGAVSAMRLPALVVVSAVAG
ncbi:hypothetical protein [Xylella fastidiosa]|nr:hypothetical protein [Xylella fastidiosa]